MHTPNRLALETSPYLLQHAHNPVDWFAWGEEALAKARTEDKPILVSVGYSACHWCHVMERECFEKEPIAQVMNRHFVCIKVDREERPDVDAVYMDAVSSMGLQGGWPLNVFLTSDARPFYGGTYFPPDQWVQLLENVAEAYRTQRDKIDESAEQFTRHIGLSEVEKYDLLPGKEGYASADLQTILGKLSARFDKVQGGSNKAPKFPMPSIYSFLLRCYGATRDEVALQHLQLTLDRMALGGIYDQVGGGFARYSVDADWFAPHFEKMLYDNAQLISLYSEAYTLTGSELYKRTVYESIAFSQRELSSAEGGFYSALDADSEGEEGKFYVWTWAEWEQALSGIALPDIDKSLFTQYYNLTSSGNWEHGNNILHANESPEEFAEANSVEPGVFAGALRELKSNLLALRERRVRPGLDDKILCSWNGLMLKGLTDAYRAFGEQQFLDMALRTADFLRTQLKNGEGLWHSYKNGRATIVGYLEDYAFVIEGYTALYQATFAEEWLQEARRLTDYAIAHFYDPDEDLFFFTNEEAERLIARKKEVFDNVIPASNSAMARNLHTLGPLLDRPDYTSLSEKALARVRKLVLTQPDYLTHWAGLFVLRTLPVAEIAIVGPEALDFRREIDRVFHPAKVLTGTTTQSTLPLLQDKTAVGGRTTIYVCYNKTCRLPVFSVEEAVSQLSLIGA